MRRIVVCGPDRTVAIACARALRDAGVEVVYAAGEATPAHVVAIVLQEDADVVRLVAAGADAEAYAGSLRELLDDHEAEYVEVETGV